MKSIFFGILGLAIAAHSPISVGEESLNYAPGGSQQCMTCHEFGPESPAHKLEYGSHGTTVGREKDRHGCESCHGPSASHAGAPIQVSPAVSFGPRWTASPAAQDKSCLACHADNIAKHWQDSLHMLNNLTCITCHDIHTGGDKVLFPAQQADVCTICHKAQKTGVHGLEDLAPRNPSCATCHNPHDHESAESRMVHNQSEGCRSCHDLVEMASSEGASEKAKIYHKIMGKPDRICLECHQDLAHTPAEGVTALEPTAVSSGHVSLFYPGMADAEWLLGEHPGSQPLYQGRNCRQCHRGEEAALGKSQVGNSKLVAHRDIAVSFDKDQDSIRMVLKWQGDHDDSDIALMWGSQRTSAGFQRGGCFAACHNDLPGMSRDRGQQTDKYLFSSRLQQQGIGRPPIQRDDSELKAMMAQGEFAVLWRIRLDSGETQAATLLDKVHWQPSPPVTANTSYKNGSWTVQIRRRLGVQEEHLTTFNPQGRYTFGIALHGKDNPGGKHWVSLPITFSYAGDDTDFKVEQ